MAKRKIKMEDLGKDHIKKHFEMVHPFLKREFRAITKTESKTKKTFKELFGDKAPFEPWKLRAVYRYQNL